VKNAILGLPMEFGWVAVQITPCSVVVQDFLSPS